MPKYEGFYQRRRFAPVEAPSPVAAAATFYSRARGAQPWIINIQGWGPPDHPIRWEVSCGGPRGNMLVEVRRID